MKAFIIDKKVSGEIKGISILLMLIHHIFTFPEWIVKGVYQPDLRFAMYFNGPTKLCVALFAFITGWGYCITNNKSYKKSINKISKFYISYILSVSFILVIAVSLCNYRPSILAIIFEIIGYKNYLMKFCWYVIFFVITMLAMPLMSRIMDKNLIIAMVTGIVIPIGIFLFMNRMEYKIAFTGHIEKFMHYFPCVCAGYICNRYGIFGWTKLKVNKVSDEMILIFSVLVAGGGKYIVETLDCIYASILFFGLANFLQYDKGFIHRFMKDLMSRLGNISSFIWFGHCIFFSDYTKSMFQPILYSSSNSVIIYMRALIMLIPVSAGMHCINKRLIDKLGL